MLAGRGADARRLGMLTLELNLAFCVQTGRAVG